MKDILSGWAVRGMYDLDYFKISPSAFFLVSCLLKECVTADSKKGSEVLGPAETNSAVGTISGGLRNFQLYSVSTKERVLSE